MVRDEALVLRSSSAGNLVGDETKTFSVPEGTADKILAVHVLIPQALAEASDTLKVTVKSTDTKHKLEVTHTDLVTQGTGTYPMEIVLPVPKCRSENWSVVLDATDADAGGDFNAGAVQVWLEVEDSAAKVDVTS